MKGRGSGCGEYERGSSAYAITEAADGRARGKLWTDRPPNGKNAQRLNRMCVCVFGAALGPSRVCCVMSELCLVTSCGCAICEQAVNRIETVFSPCA